MSQKITLEQLVLKEGPLDWQTLFRNFADWSLEFDSSSQILPSHLVLDRQSSTGLCLELALTTNFNQDNVSQVFFSSPEELLGKTVNEQSSIYHLGAIFYFALTGCNTSVYAGLDAKSLLSLDRPIKPSLRTSRFIPSAIDIIVMKCLEINPLNRFESIQELSNAISQVLATETTDEERQQPSIDLVKATWITALLFMCCLSVFLFNNSSIMENLRQETQSMRKNDYVLSLESPDFRKQLDYGTGKVRPEPGSKPIYIKQRLTGLVLFGTTIRKDFKSAVIEAVKRKIQLAAADLSNQDLSNIEIPNAYLSFACFDNSNLENSNLQHAFLKNCSAIGANFSHCKLQSTDLSKCNLASANFSNADLESTFFFESNLQSANFSNANMTNTVLSKSKLNDANLTNAKFNQTTIDQAAVKLLKLNSQQLSKANIVKSTN